ncbi:inositol-3-phosphate synthase, partial [Streptomyces anatolicus]|uniref:inositol-3-phosphate synthase n=1 Tax=Streptomyces anatolicus TaxID=2675858 RepID=UPI003557F496
MPTYALSTSSVGTPLVGVWLIGARGSVATTAIAGCAAVAAGLHAPVGMVTETPPFADCGLPTLSSLVFGGHDTANCPLPKRAEELAAGGVLPYGLPSAVHSELAAADTEIRPGGPLPGDTRTDEQLIDTFASDLRDFIRRRGLSRLVVINVASTEPLWAGGGGVPGVAPVGANGTAAGAASTGARSAADGGA